MHPEETQTVIVNAAALRLFKNEYRESSDRHSDALLVTERLNELTTENVKLRAENERLKKRMQWYENRLADRAGNA